MRSWGGSQHHYKDIGELNDAMEKQARCCCLWHGTTDCELPTELDLAIIGFPCSPYSRQRSDRAKSGSLSLAKQSSSASTSEISAYEAHANLNRFACSAARLLVTRTLHCVFLPCFMRQRQHEKASAPP